MTPSQARARSWSWRTKRQNPRYVAADLLSQAEHDELASAILVTTSEALAKEVSDWTDRFIRELSRGEIIRKSLDNYGHILLADTLEDAIDAAMRSPQNTWRS